MTYDHAGDGGTHSSSTDTGLVVALADVHFAWPDERSFAFSIGHLSVERGERLLLVGPSGSGKSTLLSLISGIVVPSSGRIGVLGHELTRLSSAERDRFRAEHLGVIFQMFNLLPFASVLDNVMLPLSFAPGRKSRVSERGGGDREAIRLLDALGLEPEHRTSRASTLSVGQQQRVAAARALIGMPEIVIADEPTSSLDRPRQEDFLDLLFAQVAKAGATLILVSHDETLLTRFDRVVSLNELLASGAAS